MLKDRNVAFLVAARFISRVGGEAAFFVGVWGKAAFEFDAGAGEIAVLMGGLGASTIAGTAISGVLVDRYDPRRVILGAELLFVPATLAMIVAGSMVQLTLFGIALGLTGAPVFTAIASFAPYLTSDGTELQRINSRIESAGLAAFIAGPAVGAFVVRYATLDWIFVIDALTSIVAVALVAPVRLRPVMRSEQTSAWRELRDGMRYSYRSRQLRFYILMGTALWFTFGSFATLEPLFFRDVLGVDVEALGWVNTVFGLGLVAGAVSLPRLPKAVQSARGLTGIAVANAGGIFVYVGTSRIEVVVLGALLWGYVIGLFAPLHRTLVHLNSPEEMVGRITGTVAVHAHGGELIPLAFVPALAAVLGPQRALLGAGVLLGLIGLAAAAEARAIDRVRSTPVPRPEGLLVADEPVSPTP
ncbi:MAG: MFS transporter [Acidimicrobiia bacterium]